MKPNYAQKRRSYLKGIWAEWLALIFLILKGYFPVKIRYKSSQGEIDLVVKKGFELVFVEVKYRQKSDDALHAISQRNQQRVRRAAEHFLQKQVRNINADSFGDSMSIRFDAITVSPYFKVIHIKNAF
jgi:putative endonuclease